MGTYKINPWVFTKILKNPSLFFFRTLNPLVFQEFETGLYVSFPSIFLSSVSATSAFLPPHLKIYIFFIFYFLFFLATPRGGTGHLWGGS